MSDFRTLNTASNPDIRQAILAYIKDDARHFIHTFPKLPAAKQAWAVNHPSYKPGENSSYQAYMIRQELDIMEKDGVIRRDIDADSGQVVWRTQQ